MFARAGSATECDPLQSHNIVYGHLRSKRLVVLGSFINNPDHIHSFHHFSEGGIALAIGIVFAPVIESRLVADTDKKLGRGRARRRAGQRDHPVLVQDMGLLRRLMRYTGKGHCLLMICFPDPALDQFGKIRTGGLVVLIQHPVERAVLIETGIHIG